MNEHLLSVENLAIHFGTGNDHVRAVDAVSYYIDRGESVAMI